MKESNPTIAARVTPAVQKWIVTQAVAQGIKPSEFVRRILEREMNRG